MTCRKRHLARARLGQAELPHLCAVVTPLMAVLKKLGISSALANACKQAISGTRDRLSGWTGPLAVSAPVLREHTSTRGPRMGPRS